MSVQQVGSGWTSSPFPFGGVEEALKSARSHMSNRRDVEFQENLRHRLTMERDAQLQQHNVHNTLLSGAVQSHLQSERHKQDKDLETHKDRIANRTFGKMAKYGQVTNYSHGGMSVQFGSPAPAPTLPSTPAATNKPQPPPVGNGLSPMFSNASNARQPQGPHPLRPQP